MKLEGHDFYSKENHFLKRYWSLFRYDQWFLLLSNTHLIHIFLSSDCLKMGSRDMCYFCYFQKNYYVPVDSTLLNVLTHIHSSFALGWSIALIWIQYMGVEYTIMWWTPCLTHSRNDGFDFTLFRLFLWSSQFLTNWTIKIYVWGLIWGV